MRNKPEYVDSGLLIVLSKLRIITIEVMSLKMSVFSMLSILVEGDLQFRKVGFVIPLILSTFHTHITFCVLFHDTWL